LRWRPSPRRSLPSSRPARCRASQVNRDLPVKIESLTLEVRDKQHQATFAGNVKLTQGDTTIQCKSLVVFYEDNPRAGWRDRRKARPRRRRAEGRDAGLWRRQISRSSVSKPGVMFWSRKKIRPPRVKTACSTSRPNNITLTGDVVVTQGTQRADRRAHGGQSDDPA